MGPFVAIDFETAHHGNDSACAVGLVRVEAGRIVQRIHRLIRPPNRQVLYTQIHGLRWRDLCDQPTFAEVWPEVAMVLREAAFLAAHNASFDRAVLRRCCEEAGLPMSGLPWLCTVRLAYRRWDLPRNRLPDVCAHLGIALDHHHALSDAEACANIVLSAPELAESLLPSPQVA